MKHLTILSLSVFRLSCIFIKSIQLLLKFKIIYGLSYFNAYLKRLSLAQSGHYRTLLRLKLIQVNFIVTIIRLFVYKYFQEKVSPKVNVLFFNIFAIEHYPANVNLALVPFLLNSIYFQHLMYFKNDDISSVVAQMILNEQNDSIFLKKYYHFKTNSVLEKTIALLFSCLSDEDDSTSPKTPRVAVIQLFHFFIITLKNCFQLLFIFMSNLFLFYLFDLIFFIYFRFSYSKDNVPTSS